MFYVDENNLRPIFFFDQYLESKSSLFKAINARDFTRVYELLKKEGLDKESYHLLCCLGYPWKIIRNYMVSFDWDFPLTDGAIYPYHKNRPITINENKMTPLYRAIQNNADTLAQDMMLGGVPIDTNALHLMITQGKLSLLRLANPSSLQVNESIQGGCQDSIGFVHERAFKSEEKTMLFRALERGYHEIVRFLMQRGAVVYSMRSHSVDSPSQAVLNHSWLTNHKSLFFSKNNSDTFFVHEQNIYYPGYYEELWQTLWDYFVSCSKGDLLNVCLLDNISEVDSKIFYAIGRFLSRREENFRKLVFLCESHSEETRSIVCLQSLCLLTICESLADFGIVVGQDRRLANPKLWKESFFQHFATNVFRELLINQSA